MIKEIKDSREVIDFAWKTYEVPEKRSYRRFDSKGVLEERMKRAINSDTERVIGCYRDDKLVGICEYFWIEEDMYAQTSALLISESYTAVADEIINYLKEHLKDYRLLIGVSAANIEASEYFEAKGMECIDDSFDTRLYKKNYKCQNVNEDIVLLDKDSFKEYAKFHDSFAGDMYWNSTHLLESFNNFEIFVYMKNNTIKGSIFTKVLSNNYEIFGLFIEEDFKGKGVEKELLKAVINSISKKENPAKELVYFIEEGNEEELKAAKEADFEVIDHYKSYEYTL